MNWILDIVLVALAVLFIYLGGRRGAVRTIVEFVGSIAAIVIAVVVGGWLGETVFTVFLREGLCSTMETTIAGSMGNSLAEQITAVSEALPEYVSRFFDSEALATNVQNAINAGAADGAVLLTDHVIGPVLVMVLRLVFMIVLFIAVKILIRLIANAVDLVAKLPVLHQLNKGLGMVCGAAKAVVVILLLAAAICAIAPFMGENAWLSTQTVEQTYLLSWVCDHNPIYHFIASV